MNQVKTIEIKIAEIALSNTASHKGEFGPRYFRIAFWLVFIAIGLLLLSSCASTPETVMGKHPPLGKLISIQGHDLHIIDQGSRGPIIVLQSGMSGWSVDWSLVQPELAKHHRVISYDRAGYGWSEEAPEPRDADSVSRELGDLLDALSIHEPIVLVGHSLGGLFVQHFARSFPSRVHGLVLVDSVSEDQSLSMPPSMRQDYEGNLLFLTGAMAWWAPSGILKVFGQGETNATAKWPEPVRSAARELTFLPRGYRALNAEMKAFQISQSQTRALPPLPGIPVHMLRSASVRDFPPGFEKPGIQELWVTLQNKMSLRYHTSVHMVSDSGHYIQLDQPQEVIQAIEAVF